LFFATANWKNLVPRKISPKFLSCFNEVKTLRITGGKIPSQFLHQIAEMQDLSTLAITQLSLVDDKHIEMIKSLPNLEHLNLNETGVTGEKLFCDFSSSASLKELLLRNTLFSDQGLEKISNFPSLATLNLCGTNLRSINKLIEMKQLVSLGVLGNGFSLDDLRFMLKSENLEVLHVESSANENLPEFWKRQDQTLRKTRKVTDREAN